MGCGAEPCLLFFCLCIAANLSIGLFLLLPLTARLSPLCHHFLSLPFSCFTYPSYPCFSYASQCLKCSVLQLHACAYLLNAGLFAVNGAAVHKPPSQTTTITSLSDCYQSKAWCVSHCARRRRPFHHQLSSVP